MPVFQRRNNVSLSTLNQRRSSCRNNVDFGLTLKKQFRSYIMMFEKCKSLYQ